MKTRYLAGLAAAVSAAAIATGMGTVPATADGTAVPRLSLH
jgi:hypothetical protein